MNSILFNIFITHIFVRAEGQTYGEMDALLAHLFNESRYNKLLRPLQNQSHVMKVNFTQYLNSIEYFDISSGELSVTEYFEIRWKDELLLWNPSLYGGREIIPLPKGKFWKPEFTLSSRSAQDMSTIYNSEFSPAWATYQGYVLMIPVGNYKTKCIVDTTLYPFDKHECNLEFVVSNHQSTELMLHSAKSGLDTRHLQENGEWEIETTNSTVVLLQDDKVDTLAFAMAQAKFILKRRPLFEFINNFIPIVLINILNFLTCFVPPDSGERLSYAVTLYLSLVFASTAIIERIPNNSLKMPLTSYGLLVFNCINTASVTWSIFISNLASIKHIQRKLPKFVVKMVMKRRHMYKPKTKTQSDNSSDTVEQFHKGEECLNKSRYYETQEKRVDNEHVHDITGLELANIFDKIYVVCVIFLLLTLNVVFIAFLVSI